MKFASGKGSSGRCGRCGDKVAYTALVADGELPNLRVCEDCRDIFHPAKRPFKAEDSSALQNPAPDTDDDSAGDTGQSLVEAMGFTRYFGGGT